MIKFKISFIVIGKNESRNIGRCLKSILKTIEINRLKNHEIIYVDSGSTDRTIDIAKGYDNVIIYKTIGYANAASARNIGAKMSNGEILFFIDGDMELIAENLTFFYNTKTGLVYDFLSGDFENNYYSKEGEYLYSENFYNLQNDIYEVTTGGLFIIKRDLWESVGGMRTEFKRSQDLDLGLRISKTGIKLLRKKEILVKHHTVSYHNSKRFVSDIVSGVYLYKGLLYKKNIFNKYLYKNFIFKEITILALLVSFLLSITISGFFLLFFPFMIVLKTIYRRRMSMSFVFQLIFLINSDIMTILSLFFFWPISKRKSEFVKIK